jgi:hypothetical protein
MLAERIAKTIYGVTLGLSVTELKWLSDRVARASVVL